MDEVKLQVVSLRKYKIKSDAPDTRPTEGQTRVSLGYHLSIKYLYQQQNIQIRENERYIEGWPLAITSLLEVMEEILVKIIFKEKDLFKLSPDYTPVIPLRMEMRRNLIKDTHSSGTGSDGIFKTGSWQRKSIRKTKDCYKFNKEIVKIRNNFHNLDLKNKIMLKYVDSIKPKTLTKSDKLLIKGNDTEIIQEDNFYLQEITENMSNLAITCDSDFKINNKTKTSKPNNMKHRNRVRLRHKDTLQPFPTENDDDDHDLMDNVLKIECNFINESTRAEINEEINGYVEEHEQNQTDIKISASENNYIGNDLNSLLILMALTPKSSNDEDEYIHKYECNQIKENEFNEENNGIAYMPHSSRSRIGENMSNFLCVAPIRIKITDREETILRKYVEKWRSYVSYKKEEFSQQRKATLDNFFDKLAKKKLQINEDPESVKKAKLLAHDFNTYQRRYKVQKHIIALQRAKLEEQNRVIEELKYNKILEASRESVDAMREQVRKNYYDLDRQLKPKIKVLSNELKLHNIEEPSLVLHCLKVPQFLQRMEKRAREREEKHAMIRERRRQMEEERIRLKQQAELAKAEMDKEEKMKRIKELKDKRKREKIETIRKKQYAARLRALIVMADLHYEKTILAKYGIRPFKILLDKKRDNIEKAKAHYVFQLKNNVFLHWMWYTEDMWFERNFNADECRRKNLLRKGIVGFKQNARQYVLQKQVADDYYDLYVTQLVFRKFQEGLEVLRKENEMKWNRAMAYHNSNILFKTFVCWRTLPALNALKRQQDARKARWREKVLQVVPDYTPPED